MRFKINEKLKFRDPYFKLLLSPFKVFTHFHFRTAVTRRTSGRSLGTFQKSVTHSQPRLPFNIKVSVTTPLLFSFLLCLSLSNFKGLIRGWYRSPMWGRSAVEGSLQLKCHHASLYAESAVTWLTQFSRLCLLLLTTPGFMTRTLKVRVRIVRDIA
jgi:hypothetical protein